VNVILGDDADALHWTEAALVALILANSPPPATRWELLTDGDIDDTQFIFAGGDAIYVEVPL